jgi:hypothetical protein
MHKKKGFNICKFNLNCLYLNDIYRRRLLILDLKLEKKAGNHNTDLNKKDIYNIYNVFIRRKIKINIDRIFYNNL